MVNAKFEFDLYAKGRLHSYKKENRKLNGLKVNKESSTFFGDMTVQDSLTSVYHNTPLKSLYKKALENHSQSIAYYYLTANFTELDRLLTDVFKSTYIKMSKSRRNSDKIKTRGNDTYAIGTGETLRKATVKTRR